MDINLVSEGEILDKDLYYKNTLLLTKGSVINERLKQKLITLGFSKIWVAREIENTEEVRPSLKR